MKDKEEKKRRLVHNFDVNHFDSLIWFWLVIVTIITILIVIVNLTKGV